MIRKCNDCKTVELLTKKSKIYGKCSGCRNKTRTELKRRIQWEKLLYNASLMEEGEDKRKVTLGIIKGRKNYLKTGSLGGSVEREFGYDVNKKIIKSTEM